MACTVLFRNSPRTGNHQGNSKRQGGLRSPLETLADSVRTISGGATKMTLPELAIHNSLQVASMDH